MKYKQKAFAVIFLHSEGWTVSAVKNSREVAGRDMKNLSNLGLARGLLEGFIAVKSKNN